MVEESKKPGAVDFVAEATEDTDGSGLLHLAIVPPKEGARQPAAFICLIDISGSMNEQASLETGPEVDSFSRLDLVKHSVKTIITMMSPTDYVALVAFDDNAVTRFPLVAMTEASKKKALEVLEAMHPEGSTNIWGALKEAVDISRANAVCKTLNTNILLFTDGEPNVNPPGGIIPTLKKYTEGPRPYTIHCFGYGYRLQSDLLLAIAVHGSGIFNYIPDCTMIGTIFVNFLSNVLATAIKGARIYIKGDASLELKTFGCYMADNRINVGPIQYGQQRDVIMKFKVPASKQFAIHVDFCFPGDKVGKDITALTPASANFQFEHLRAIHCENMAEAIASQSAAGANIVKKTLVAIAASPIKDDERVKALARDIESAKESEGQLSKAFSKNDWVHKWGIHYTRSLVRAHQLQQCHNFKDPGVQIYGGALFKATQDQADTLFCTLPAPKPSIPKSVQPSSPSYVPAPVDMHSYMNYGGGCFDGEGRVTMLGGKTKRVMELRKGDVLCNGAKVIALVSMRMGKEIDVVEIGGVKLTPWHPVRMAGTWKFPVNVGRLQKYFCEYICNLVLDTKHVATINGVEVLTLGHGMTDNSVVAHPYFGSQKVIEDLMNYVGWSSGEVKIERWNMARDPATGLVQGIHS